MAAETTEQFNERLRTQRIGYYSGEKRRHAVGRAQRKGTRLDDDHLRAWRAARMNVCAADAQSEVEWLEIWRALRVLALERMPPAKRKIAPAAPEVFSFAAIVETQRAWNDAIPKAKRADYAAAWRPLGDELTASRERVEAARQVCKDAAAQVECRVQGTGTRWQCVRSVYVHSYSSQGLGDQSYARASASMRYRELQSLGYAVKFVARRNQPRPPAEVGHVWCFEVWALTCDEGRQIIDHQYPRRFFAEALNAAADEGVNPVALFGNLIPVKFAIETGAMSARRALAPQIQQILLEYDEQFPLK